MINTNIIKKSIVIFETVFIMSIIILLLSSAIRFFIIMPILGFAKYNLGYALWNDAILNPIQATSIVALALDVLILIPLIWIALVKIHKWANTGDSHENTQN